mmetsp:Transcript_534/g.1050  ORF Transcript_534/g.1050 Transcript_534/m.1050 type:complete len:91 (-) Transcript_534:1036-1308(-)
MADRKAAVIKTVDMGEDMTNDALDAANRAFELFTKELDVASYVRKEFDKKYNPTWHCVVGRSYGSYVTHATKHFIYFQIGQLYFLVWKSN